MWKDVLHGYPWVVIVCHGALRDRCAANTGRVEAHQLSTVSGVVLFGVYIGWSCASGDLRQ